MPSYDFEVDLPSLVKAAQATAEVVKLKKDKDISDVVPTEGAVGNETVWSAVAEFSERWERGFNDLVGDVEEIAGRLGKVAMTYAEFDKKGAEAMTTVAAAVKGVGFPGVGTGDGGTSGAGPS